MKPKSLPNYSPVINVLSDGVALLRSAIESHESPTATMLSRSASMHFISAMHAVSNAILWFQEENAYFGCNISKKFDRIAELSGLGSLPDEEVDVAHELDAISNILFNPMRAQSVPFGTDADSNKIEFERTPLKKFNRESVHWIPEYSAAVLLLALRFLNRVFTKHLDFDHAQVDVLLGDHLATTETYVAGMSVDKLAELRANLEFLNSHESTIEAMNSSRWLFLDARFEIEFAAHS